MDPHAHVQAEFNQYADERLKERIITTDYPDTNLTSLPPSAAPMTAITDAPIATAPMDATAIPGGDITGAALVAPGQVPDPAGGDCCCWGCGDCGDCGGGDCGSGDCGGGGGGDCGGGGGGGCTIM
ncbi:hypothetical protein K457DRAFT_121709 [Linnemannia elongata AG-77]|uniref:Uncharacterized protein n=1 Tax=Linnemannia elongata AG-77 TaxID=1314771 RepID=A0A197KCZ1_9FUNG|nr:hypothetical protein K457DRAFT_121709 [Linnemannia elongata AG-77]